jgi:hypothetical protein
MNVIAACCALGLLVFSSIGLASALEVASEVAEVTATSETSGSSNQGRNLPITVVFLRDCVIF